MDMGPFSYELYERSLNNHEWWQKALYLYRNYFIYGPTHNVYMNKNYYMYRKI